MTNTSHNLKLSTKGLNTLVPRQKGRHFPDNIFKCIFLNENVWTLIKIPVKFVPKGPINNSPALFQIMALCRPGDKPLSETMMVTLLTHICVTRPQWVNETLFEQHYFNVLATIINFKTLEVNKKWWSFQKYYSNDALFNFYNKLNNVGLSDALFTASLWTNLIPLVVHVYDWQLCENDHPLCVKQPPFSSFICFISLSEWSRVFESVFYLNN